MAKLALMKTILKESNERDFILCLIGLNTGLKLEDILQLTVKHVQDTHIKIKEKSTKKTTRLLINPPLKQALTLYIQNKPHDHYLVSKKPTLPLEESEALTILKTAATQAGLTDFDSDTMRRTFGHHLYKQGIEIRLLQELLRESSPEATLQYIGWFHFPFISKRFGEVI